MKLVFLGPPGAGKGTVAAKISAKYNIPHISTGELFRNNIKNKTELGRKVSRILESGDLVPDEITIEIVKQRLSEPDAATGFILDGFPRTITQAEALKSFADLDMVLNFECGKEEIIRRLTGRRQCPECGRIYHIEFMPPQKEGICDDDGAELITRSDDKIDSVENRLVVYNKSTEPLINWYKEEGLLTNINAELSPEEVFSEADKILSGIS